MLATAALAPAAPAHSVDDDRPERPKTILRMRWFPSLESALSEAQPRSRRESDRGKPVLWLRMLGDLEGDT